MPYYVFAIHTDNTNNQLYGSFDSFEEAAKLGREMASGNYPGDNYFIRMFYAENDRGAEKKADALRAYPRLRLARNKK